MTSHKDERLLEFAEDRVSGEWFRYSQAIRDWIKQDEDRRARERGWRMADRR
jgi:hypothetical protein